MAGNIKGITIELRGDPTPLTTALNKVHKEFKQLDTELKYIEKGLKFNPGNTELLAQKQAVLKERIEATREKLDSLRASQEKYANDDSIDKNSAEWRRLQREIIETENELKKLERHKFTELGNELKDLGGKMESLGKSWSRYVTAPIVGALGAATKASITYGDAIAKTSTIMDKSKMSTDELSKGILQLSNETGKGSSELAEATYQALSASVATEDVLEFVKTSANLAKAGFLETSGAVDVLTTVINAYGYEASDAQKISEQLVQTQNDGKTTVDELAKSYGNVIPTAAALHVPLEQLNAMYVQLTRQGMDTSTSTTAINAMLNELSKSGSKTAKILQDETGKSFGQLMKEGYTVGDILEILYKSCDNDSEAFKNLFGNVRAGKGALGLLNSGIDEYNAEVEKMAGATGNVSRALEDLNTPGAKARKALNQLVNAGIQLGDTLAPYVEKAATMISKFCEKFDKLSPTTKDLIVKLALLVAAVGPLLTVGGKLTKGVGTLLTNYGEFGEIIPGLSKAITGVTGVFGKLFAVLAANPIVLIVAAIAALVAAFIYLWNNCEPFREFWINLWNSIKEIVISVVEAIKNFLTTAWETITNTVQTVWGAISEFFTTIFEGIRSTVETVWNAIKTVIETIINAIKDIIIAQLTILVVALGTIWHVIQTAATAVWDQIKGYVLPVVEAIKSTVENVFNTLKETLTKIWDALKSAAKTAWDGIKKYIIDPVVQTHNKVKAEFDAVKSFLDKTWDSIKTKASNTWNSIKSTASTTWSLIADVITKPANFAAEKLKNAFNNVKSFLSDVWRQIRNTASTAWNHVKEAILEPVERLKDRIQDIIERIKKFFDFRVPTPHIPVPHFHISPSGWTIGDLLDGEIPYLDVSWHKKGAIFDKPTIFHGVGEAGPEAVLPLDALWERLDSMADSIVNGIITGLRATQLQGAGGDITIPIYLYPSGPKMGEETVHMYDKYKKILG